MKLIKHTLYLTNKWLKDIIGTIQYSVSSKKNESEILLNELKNCHIGKRAFIICNGPSLKAEDLTKIHNNGDISFASNKIHFIFQQTPWRPTYYTVMDESYQHSLLDVMNLVPAAVKFFRITSFSTTKKVQSATAWLNAYGDKDLLENPKFSEDISKIIYTIGTVTYAMLQMAVHMGIREIYIIGCDNSYGKEIKKDGTIVNHGGASYFAGSNDNKSNSPIAATWQMDLAYEFARKYADNHDIKIFNATRGGYLEAFQRVEFDSLFK